MSLLIAGTHKKVYAIISIEAFIKYLEQIIIEISKKYHFALPFVYIYITINVVSVLLLRLITNCLSPTINILLFTIILTSLTNQKLYVCMYVWSSHIARVTINRVGSPILLVIR